MAERGLVSQGIGLAYIVMNAELEGVICSGPVRGAQQTYALLDERVPRSAEVGGDIAELARQILPGSRPGQHPGPGPLVLADHRPVPGRSWSSQGPAGLPVLSRVLSCGSTRQPPAPDPSTGCAADACCTTSVTLSYPAINFPQANGHPHPPGEDLFVGCVILAETNVGLWRRTLQGRKMIMEITLAPVLMAQLAAPDRGRSRRPGSVRWKGAGADDHRLTP